MKYNHKRFISSWKTDNKEWLKQRRKGWKNIQLQLDRLRACYVLNGVKKSDYRYFKHYYLFGKDTVNTSSDTAFRCLGQHSPDHNQILILQFWLSADHSDECLDYLKNNFVASNGIDFFESACDLYRETTKCYPYSGKYGWSEDEGTTEANGPVFGDLEPKMLSMFSYTPELESWLDEYTKKDRGSTVQRSFEGVFIGYFGGLLEEPEIDCGFNPNNPIKNMLGEYMRWGFQKNRGDDDIKGCLIAVALIWYVVDTPEGRHPIQLEVAIELKQRILDGLGGMPVEAQNRYNLAMEYYDSGEFKEYLLDYQ